MRSDGLEGFALFKPILGSCYSALYHCFCLCFLLSSRLVTINTENDLFILTFKTVQEIWKFSNYLSLGFVSRCLENQLFDSLFWLDVVLIDVTLQVEVNEAQFSVIYLDLLLQEGEAANLARAESGMSVNGAEWSMTLGSLHRWFLKTCTGSVAEHKEMTEDHFPHPISTGTCFAAMIYEGDEKDELCFCEGDRIKIIGFLLSNLKWFMGKSLSTGETGFVQVKHVFPEEFKAGSGQEEPDDLGFVQNLFPVRETLCQEHATALYVNLASVYLKQKMKDKGEALAEKATSLLLCITHHTFSSENELDILNIALGKAILTDDCYLESRICFLVVRLFLAVGKGEEALPYAKHLQFLSKQFGLQRRIVPIELNVLLAALYADKCLPRLALAAVRLAQSSTGWIVAEANQASAILNSLLQSSHETEQRGVVYNMLAISQREEKRLKEALKSCLTALMIPEETVLKRNQALAQANTGSLMLSYKSFTLSGRYLRKSLQLYLEMDDCTSDEGFVQVLLWLGQYHVDRGMREDGRLHYELALATAMSSNDIHCKDGTIIHKHITLTIHWLKLVPNVKDKEQELKILNTLSHLYLNLSSYKSSIDFTKQRLKSFIDLGMKEKEAGVWLMAGKIYHMKQKDELVELYLQVSHQLGGNKSRQSFELNSMFIKQLMGKTSTIDIDEKPITHLSNGKLLSDGAITLARLVGDPHTELGLLNKLTQLNMAVRHAALALECAIAAVRLSVNFGDQLKQQVAFYRLATVYYSAKEYKMAENYYLKSLSLCSQPLLCAGESKPYMRVYCRLGEITLHQLEVKHLL
uniref:SH3 domain and tetratricopeptide repeats 1 n=1 Tax=Callorhinchus milii TaxID=7868 RepID=A0A4W3GQY8_CALMI